MKPRNQFLGASALFIFAIAIGAYQSMTSWKGIVYWYPEHERDPAAIRKVFDFSHLEGRALKMASYKRLIADANVVEKSDGLGIVLGHFVIKGTNQQRQFACDVYNKIELKFESADMSVSGEPSIMKVEADCSVEKDINTIGTLWIPMEKILSEKAGDIELQITDPQPIKFTFTNIGDRWPRAWVLSNVFMYNELDLTRKLQINRQEVHEILDRPLTLVWDKDL